MLSTSLSTKNGYVHLVLDSYSSVDRL